MNTETILTALATLCLVVSGLTSVAVGETSAFLIAAAIVGVVRLVYLIGWTDKKFR